ncbi:MULTISPECIES: hypothetical protein [unclassified Synechocystis]|uniref:hypothetical protein n=1 Tax=unclassified Synechocystis TaxID=2640012 RepID=UPI000410C7BE|nr:MULTISPECIES: hypothetical protein [unclassified Synechocystis]AIE75410.1 hypothetical protein D082_28820 [Synechocystis sp. PCC 6714]MCT0253637.1 hypothetical protein [Synechocystis sp. CS-94]
MDDWEKNLWLAVETFATAMESWVEDVEQALEEVAETIEAEWVADLEWLWQEWTVFWDEFSDFDGDLNDLDPFGDRHSPGEGSGQNDGNQDWNRSFMVPWSPLDGELGLNPHLPANENHQPACRGCQHYHGYVYNGQLLVCAMHPYGWETESCPDWEEVNLN